MSKERSLFRSAVFVAIENERGEILLQRRGKTGFLDGYWDLSATGHLEYNESCDECGVREVLEETGLHIVPDT
jgi:8-oxo-dGTP pyrophosphatase MutT (NUDIX family)